MNTTRDDRTDEILERLDLLSSQIALLADRAERQRELFDELGPISKQALALGQTKLGALEERGYFAFGESLLGVIDRVVTGYGPEDVEQLGENIVTILDVVRRVTQPDVLAIASDAASALDHSDEVEPKGVLGMLRETRDDDVRRGVAIALEVLRYVGRGAAGIARPATDSAGEQSDARAKLAAKLAPRRANATPRPAEKPTASAAPARPKPTAPDIGASNDPTRAGFEFVADESWSRDYAQRTAASLGVTDFTDVHWTVISFARQDHAATGKAPNIRRVTSETGVDTRAVYQLFPKAPGLAIALCAGVPKPAGCL